MMSKSKATQKLPSLFLGVFLILLTENAPAYAHISTQASQVSNVVKTADVKVELADVQAVKTLALHYGLKHLLENLNDHSFSVKRGNFMPALFSIMKHIDDLIATGTVNPVRKDDIVVVQHLQSVYSAQLILLYAQFDYAMTAIQLEKRQFFTDIQAGVAGTLIGNSTFQPPQSKGETISPCFYPTFEQPDGANVQALRAIAKRYNVTLLPSKSSATSALLENRPIARHEFAAALDAVLTKTVEQFRASPSLVPEKDRVTLQRLADDYAIELTSKVLFSVHTKLYTYCLN